MSKSTRATLTSCWWKSFYNSIRFCHSCGAKLDFRHVKEEGVRRHVCTVCATITYLNPKVVAALIPVTVDGRVALLQRDIEPGYGKWSYPAGYMELRETVEQAAIRETWEEIRVRVTSVRFQGIYSYDDAGVVTIVYVGTILRSDKPKIGHESQGVDLFKPSEIPWKKLAFRSTIHALKDWKNKKT